ncbi:CO6A6-like protein [Mya arenaria]|uniref:CO6A6-like protein n=1 Tax=Mya arenaria TaxID=6604 RepID=A0ABY7EMD6_MYAAR|nr:CO6A6-like protein [Mya arenaria]
MTAPCEIQLLSMFNKQLCICLLAISEPACDFTDADLIFLLDASTSISNEKFANILDLAKLIVNKADIDSGGVRIGLASFDNEVHVHFALNKYSTKFEIVDAIDNAKYVSSATKYRRNAMGILRKRMFVQSNGDRPGKKSFLVIVTDGLQEENMNRYLNEAIRMKRNNVKIMTVGVGVDNSNRLFAASSDPKNDYSISVDNFGELKSVPALVLPMLPDNCKAPRVEGYDVIFVLDSSVTPEHFRWMNNYARAVVREMSIDDGEFRYLISRYYNISEVIRQTSVRIHFNNIRMLNEVFLKVGYLIYSNSAYRQFDLQDYGTRSDVLSAIDKVGYRPGTKNTAAALKYARKQMFTPSKGDREYAKNYLILLTGDNPRVGMFGVGFGDFSNRDELTAYSSVPNDEYQSVMRQESDQSEAPGLMLYNLKNNCFASGDIVFILDSSGSVGQDNFYRYGILICIVINIDIQYSIPCFLFFRVLNFTYSTIDGLDIDSGHFRVGVTTFSDSSRLDFNLNDFSNKQDIHDALTQRVCYSCNKLMLVTEYICSSDAAGVTIITLAVGFTSETSELVGLTSPPISENLVYTEDYESLSKVKDKLIEPLCHDCGEPSDVVIVLDSSNTVGEYNFGRLKEYSEHLVREMNKDSCDILNFTSTGTYDDTETNVRAVEQISYSRGRANMAAAFRSLRTEMFNGRGGDRPGARNIAYFLTDGTNDAESEMAESEAEQAISSGISSKHMFSSRCSAKGDVVFAVDTSRYVTRKELKSIRRFLRSVVKRLKFNKNEFSVGMVQFTDWAQVSLTLSQGKSKKAVRKSIAGLRVHGGDPQPSIALAKAKYRIFDAYGEDKDRPNYLILITKSMRGEEDILTEANKLKLEGTRILGVDENLCAENPCRNGGVCQRLGGDFYCDCGVGYAGRYCENTCNARADIVFLLDSSGSIGHKDFRRVKKFVHNMVSDLQIGKDASRIGLATYSSKSR